MTSTRDSLSVLTSSGFADIVGFGPHGIWTALGNGDGTFQDAKFVLENFGVDQGWQVDKHPRFVVDLNGNGFPDIVGFGDLGVWTALGNGDGSFQNARFALENFGVDQGWQVDRHPRFAVDLAGNGYADIVGFGDAGVWTAMNDGSGAFPASNFVLANFGYGTIVLAITAQDLAAGSRGIWRSTDGGATWVQVYQFSSNESAGQLEWALGSDHLVYAAVGSSVAISKDAGATFQYAVPWGTGPAARVNHVAVWQNSPADVAPAIIYALGNSTMFLSFDGGATWMRDQGTLKPNVGGAVGWTGNSNTPKVMVISPRFPLEIFVAQNGTGTGTGAVLYRADYSHFPFGDQTSIWDSVPLPDLLTDPTNQDAGHVFLLTTQKGRGDLLFYGPQRLFNHNSAIAAAYVAPLYPASGSDWQALDPVHVDLHGFLLSPDFAAKIENGQYQPGTGTVWILSDGGVYRSTDGGKSFQGAHNVNTLSCVNVAGVSTQGNGPALCLNQGDNAGYYSMDGGANWSYLQYNEGDNDCSFADPLRSYSILVFTPRWNPHSVTVYETTPGNLPNAAETGTSTRYIVPGPPAPNVWNANSGFGNRGSRPIVLGLAGEGAPTEGDYIFILNPTTQPILVRTQNIQDIASGDEWLTTATGPGQGANVYLQGPPLPPVNPNPPSGLQNPSLGIVQASGGHWKNNVFYVGGDATLWKWTEGATAWTNLVPGKLVQGAEANFAFRFFADPYRRNLIYIVDTDHVKRSDDGGVSWTVDQLFEAQLTWGGQIALSSNDNSSGIQDEFDMILTDMQFDPSNPLVRFAVGQGGAFYTNDGVNWIRLLHTGALTGRPANCYYDWISTPSDPALYVSFAGRSVVKISDLP